MGCKVIFQPSGCQLEVEEGTDLLKAAQQAGVEISAYCGGEGSCGKCKVRVLNGHFEKYQMISNSEALSVRTVQESALLTKKELDIGYRMACEAQIYGDVVIEVPRESRLQEAMILEEGQTHAVALCPAVKAYYLELDKAALIDNRDDFTRVQDALKEYSELESELEIDFAALRELSKAIREGDWKVTIYILYGIKIIGAAAGKTDALYGVAADVGTTTVAVYLCDMNLGQTVQTGSFINPQVSYGDDVISRVSYCIQNEDGLQRLQGLLVQELNRMVQELADREGIVVTQIAEMVMVFNTVMETIALGISPKSLGFSPFVSPIAQSVDISARELGIALMAGANIHCLPSEAGFVGADNVAVLIAQEPYRQEKMKMIIDIGTNSEICLGNQQQLYVTSCATGPALEGAQISCGMRAAKGAIEAVRIHSDTLEPEIKVIGGDETPKGICGSGILDVVSQMVQVGILKKNGRFAGNLSSRRIRKDERGQMEYVLYFKQRENERDITVKVRDIRAVQLAKAALYAGAKMLMNCCGVEKVDELVLAGAFGSYINTENALYMGLFPEGEYKEIQTVGNAAGAGARLALLSVKKRKEAGQIARQVKFIETAAKEEFSKCFSRAMLFPESQ